MNYSDIELPSGIDHHKVPMIAWSIMSYYGGRLANYPDWFTCNWDYNYPREDETVANHSLATYIVLEQMSQKDENWEKDYGEVLVWIIENLNGPWATFGHPCYFFADDEDAMAFKLTWN